MARSFFSCVVLLIVATLFRTSAFMSPSSVGSITRTCRRSASSLSMNNVVVEFTQTGKTVSAPVGTPLSQLCAKNGIKVKYNCKQGNCATCEINVDGRYVKACQGKVQSSRRIVKIKK